MAALAAIISFSIFRPRYQDVQIQVVQGGAKGLMLQCRDPGNQICVRV